MLIVMMKAVKKSKGGGGLSFGVEGEECDGEDEE